MEDDVKKLAMLGVADKYRLADIKERLDMGKDLYISDKEFLENLSMVHLGRSLSRITKSQLVIDETVAEPVSDVREPEPEVVSEPEPVIHKPEPQLPEAKKTLAKKSRKQELEDYEKEYLNRAQRQPDTGGFTITEDGEVGKRVARKTKPRKKATTKTAKPRKKATTKTAKPRKKAKSKTDSCVKCGAKISTDDVFCTNCGSKK
jgi:site-specific DNA-cytosine methylase